PADGRVAGRNGLDVVLDVQQVRAGVRIGGDGLVDVPTHERQRQGGEGQVQGRGGRILVEVIRRLDLIHVQVRAWKRTRVGDNRHVRTAVGRHDVRAEAGAERIRERRVRIGYRRAFVVVKRPLRLA